MPEQERRFRTRFYSEDDEWTVKGSRITSKVNIDRIRQTLENEGPIIVEHWHYRGASSPDRFVFDDFDDFTTYLQENAFAGDAIHVWSFTVICKDDNTIASGKCPDEKGRVPRGGAY
jgi:hypothetical protein